MGSLTQVSIDFDTSHLVFPILIACVLGALGLVIIVTRRQRIAAAVPYWAGIGRQMDKARFLGALALTLVYFMAMVPVGQIWPNTGRGFLICSIPFVFLTGFLFMHDRGWRRAIPLVVVSLVAPTLIWWLFTDLFFLTLP